MGCTNSATSSLASSRTGNQSPAQTTPSNLPSSKNGSTNSSNSEKNWFAVRSKSATKQAGNGATTKPTARYASLSTTTLESSRRSMRNAAGELLKIQP